MSIDLFAPKFSLPESPDSKDYAEVAEFINNTSFAEHAATYISWCENDFWFFCRFCLSTGSFTCGDEFNTKWYGKPWLDHPWLFDRCRDIQLDSNNPPKLRKWPRGHLKTELITKDHTLWDNARNSREDGTPIRTLILTFKKDTTGQQLLWGIKSECETNLRLPACWPHVFYEDPKHSTKGAKEWKTDKLRFRQSPGIREASVVLASVENMPTSGHFDRIKFDDPVVQETVTSKDQMSKTYRSMQETVPLGADHTVYFFVGTSWRAGDPWDMGEADGMFEVDHQDCYGPMSVPSSERKTPVLYSAEWYQQKRDMMGAYSFAAQYRGDPAAESEFRFEDAWINTYYTDPQEEKNNGNVFVIIDPARDKKDGADYTAITVLKHGPDGFRYVLDMYRERLSVGEFKDLLFYLAGDPEMMDSPKPWWGKGDWRPRRGVFKVFEEVYGANRDIDHIKEEMDRRSYRFKIEPIPRDPVSKQLSKVERIRGLMTELESGLWVFPPRFGHSPRGDNRDVLQVFIDEEYRRWTPEGGSEHDDLLDTMAWASRPGLKKKMPWPLSANKNLSSLVESIKGSRPTASAWGA